MWRAASVSFSSPCHPGAGWTLLRRQVATAQIARSDGEVPPLALLLDEAARLAAILRHTGHLPFERGGTESFQSLSADILGALGRVGPSLRSRVGQELGQACHPSWSPSAKGGLPPWQDLFQAAEGAHHRLQDPEALAGALDDAIEATRATDVAVALVALKPRLDDLRATAELQGRSWERVVHTIEHYLTIESHDPEGHVIGGAFPSGTSPEMVVGALRDALSKRRHEREYAVWVSALAGPGVRDAVVSSPTLAGPIAVSGIVCTGDVSAWLAAVKRELRAVFEDSGQAVPADIEALGEAERWNGTEMLDAEALWRHMASPASFVVRIALRASYVEEAIQQANEALGVVLKFGTPHLPHGIRADPVVWTATGGWSKPRSTARGLAVGEVHAARRAAEAVSRWADDLGSPIDRRKLDLLRSRAMVRDPLTPAEVRLTRAFTSLEALTPPQQKTDHVGKHLWMRSAWGEMRALLGHLLDRALDPGSDAPPNDGATPDDRRSRAEQLRSRLSAESLPWDTSLLDAIEWVWEVVDHDAMLPSLARAARTHLLDPRALVAARERHAAAFKRARRHRNLTTHGHQLGDHSLMSTVAFLADQLEYAVAAQAVAEDPSQRWIGSLAVSPEDRLVGGTLADVLGAVAHPGPRAM